MKGVSLCDTLQIKTETSVLLGWENHSKTCILPTVCSPKATFNISEVLVAFFPQFKAEYVADTPFFQVRHFLCTPKLPKEQHTLVLKQDIAQQSEVLWPYIKQEIIRQALLYLHLPVVVCARCSSVILRSVQKLPDHTTYIPHPLSSTNEGNMKKKHVPYTYTETALQV
jgi:hypothetical protein